ncbi:MAG: filamentous hemagglutinin N-terminal domain-containing protein [Candidatus Symbiobacter sp.]|nr:filamentous hemagglutinin N-terminal domain-containing protein [Candidatus Symbiobacter sp.]
MRIAPTLILERMTRIAVILAVMVMVMITPHGLLAMPTGGVVTRGDAHIAQTNTNMTIRQTTLYSVIEWLGFSIAVNETVQYNMPKGGAVMNRVTGKTVSQIDGQIISNGTVYLVNPNGLVFNSKSKVNSQNFIASTIDIDDNIFLKNGKNALPTRPKNRAANPASRITLKGVIEVASRGAAEFFAPNISNQGVIKANLGKVILGGTESLVVDFNGDGLLNFELGPTAVNKVTAVNKDKETANHNPSPPSQSIQVINSGLIAAEGGAVYLTAQAAKDLTNAVVDNEGVIEAKSLVSQGGTVVLMAAGGDVINNGSIDVSGKTGGGAVYLGGDFHGTPLALSQKLGLDRNAMRSFMGPAGHINANATHDGKGGLVVLWGDDATAFQGRITANGGALGGNGGAVEVSGRITLNFNGDVSTTAAFGQRGSLLLDPTDITIANVRQSDVYFCKGGPCKGQLYSHKATSILSVNSLNNLLVTNDVTINANKGNGPATSSGTITIDAGIYWTSGHSLTFEAGTGGIILTNQGTITGNGSVKFATQNGNLELNNYILLSGGKQTSLDFELGSGEVIYMNQNAAIIATSLGKLYNNNNLINNMSLQILRNNNGLLEDDQVMLNPGDILLETTKINPSPAIAPEDATDDEAGDDMGLIVVDESPAASSSKKSTAVRGSKGVFYITNYVDSASETNQTAKSDDASTTKPSESLLLKVGGVGRTQEATNISEALRRFRDDLAVNYLYPMQGNTDLWNNNGLWGGVE